MKLIVTANIVPFMRGGAEYHIQGLVDNLRLHGHEVELIRFPFRFSPESEVQRLMDFCAGTDLRAPGGVQVDRVISLQFPTWGVYHDKQCAWVMHQHRASYELFDAAESRDEERALRESIIEFDNQNLGRMNKCFANSERVAERLQHNNQIGAEALYHPPPFADRFYCAEQMDYVFYPSRLESLKRQDLLIRAAAHMVSPLSIVIAGTGGQQHRYKKLIDELGVADRVHMVGRTTEAEKFVWYARALGVVFVPHDEDYGYVTLEAMLSHKPVITASDSGGPLEFVRDGQTGSVVEPDPVALAASLDALYNDKQRAREMGEEGYRSLSAYEISWDRVVEQLIA